jgi:hypothetical protein
MRQHHDHGETDTGKELSHESRGASRRRFPSAMGHNSQPAGPFIACSYARCIVKMLGIVSESSIPGKVSSMVPSAHLSLRQDGQHTHSVLSVMASPLEFPRLRE